MRVSVIVPAMNAEETLERTLEALAAQDLVEPFEVIVVDDGSADRTAEIAADAGPPVVGLHQERQGPAAARNLGAAAATGRILVFTDADCMPTPGWLRHGIEALAGADLVQGAVRPDPQAPRSPLDRSLWVVAEAGLYEAANLFVTSELFERLGGFEDPLGARIGKPLGEDTWFGWRARRAGARTAFCEPALVHHAVFQRGLPDYVAERARLVYFPALVARVPELRRSLLYCRVFLSRRTAAFDLAVAASAAAALLAFPPALALAVPYCWIMAVEATRWRRHAPRVLVAGLLADLLGAASLIAGSLRARRPVL